MADAELDFLYTLACPLFRTVSEPENRADPTHLQRRKSRLRRKVPLPFPELTNKEAGLMQVSVCRFVCVESKT